MTLVYVRAYALLGVKYEPLATSETCTGTLGTFFPRVQGYLACETATPLDPAVGLCLGPCGGPLGVVVSYERGTPVPARWGHFFLL